MESVREKKDVVVVVVAHMELDTILMLIYGRQRKDRAAAANCIWAINQEGYNHSVFKKAKRGNKTRARRAQ